MIYLREVKVAIGRTIETSLEIFEGDKKEDEKYWKTTQKAISVRYFKLEEIK